MGRIDSEAAARRLAHVVVTDIKLYNDAAWRAGHDLTAAIAEGRALYRMRVDPSLFDIYETMLSEAGLSHAGRAGNGVLRAVRDDEARIDSPVAQPATTGRGLRDNGPPESRLPGQAPVNVAIFVIFGAVVVALAMWLLLGVR